MSVFGSPLFVRSTPTPLPSHDLHYDVTTLVEKAQRSQNLSPAVRNFLETRQSAFFDVFSRQVELIKSRSQDLRDAQITIFDKALMVLTEHPNCLMNAAAIKFFCEEYLNIDLGGPTSALTQTLQQSIQVPEALKQAVPSDDSTAIDPEVEAKPSRPGPLNPNFRKDMEPKLATMWTVYESAREDYSSALDNSLGKDKIIKTARFLRDTAENILLYLQNKNADALMITELDATFSHAKTTVVCLTGGKKRKFDRAEIDKVKGVPRGPSLPMQSRDPHYPQITNPAGISKRHGSGHGAPYGSSNPNRGGPGYDHRGQTQYPEPFPRWNTSTYQDEHPVAATGERDRDRLSSYAEETYSYTVSASGAEHYRRRDYTKSRDRDNHHVGRQLTPDPNPGRGSEPHTQERSTRKPSHRRRGTDRYRGQGRSRSRSRSPDQRSRSPSSRHEYNGGPKRRGHDRGEYRGTHHGSRSKTNTKDRGYHAVPYDYRSGRKTDSYVPSRDKERDYDENSMDEGEL